jgi:hypothetical protein
MHSASTTDVYELREEPQIPVEAQRKPAASRPADSIDVATAYLSPSRVPAWVEEPRTKRWLFVLIALFVAWGYFWVTQQYWGPAHSGNNQNGYLVGGKFLAQKGTTGFEPPSPFSFVGWMWVMADANSTAPGGGMHYPKYPVGLPLIYGLVYKFAPPGKQIDWVYLVNPIAMSLGILGVFFFTRAIAGSFAGIVAMLLLAIGPVTLVLTNNPNSHATGVMFATWGMFFLLRWWQRQGLWRALVAGLLLGYAVTIRYTEGLLLIPLVVAGLTSIRFLPWRSWERWSGSIFLLAALAATIGGAMLRAAGTGGFPAPWVGVVGAFGVLLLAVPWARFRDSVRPLNLLRLLAASGLVWAAWGLNVPGALSDEKDFTIYAATRLAVLVAIVLLFALPWSQPRRYMGSVVLGLGWLIPVAGLVAFNLSTFGTLTGYDSTNESTGFTIEEFQRKWDFALRQLYGTGLYFILPLSVMGVVMGFRWNWRAATLLLLWWVPGTLLYMAYYYGMNMPVIGYLRFFMTLFPPAVIAAAWVIAQASRSLGFTTPDDRALRLGSTAGPVGAAALIAVAGLVNLRAVIGPMERDLVIAFNLDHTTREILRNVPAGSVVFGNSQRLCNHLQFAGDYELYGADYFRNGYPVPTMGTRDGNDPNPIQPARRKFLDKAYSGLGDRAMVEKQNQIVRDSLQAGKRVFVILEAGQAGSFRNAFLTRAFEVKTVRQFTEPMKMSDMSEDASRTLADLRQMGFGRGSPSTWLIIEVLGEKQAPATAPATAPADRTVDAETASPPFARRP